MRAVRSVRLMVSLAVFVSAMALGSASASAFSLSSSTSTTQAAAPTNLNYTYVATGSESLTSLDVALPAGMMRDPSSAPACPVALFDADRCPATSRVGTVAMQLVALGARVDVPGTIYHLDAPGDDAAITYGTVLRPPFSSLGLVAKSRAGHRVLFDDRGGITETTRGLPDRISTFLGSVPARVARFTARFDGTNATGNLLHNPTSCASQPLRATATFSDGSSQSRSSTQTTTGCPLVPLTSDAEVTLDDPKPGLHTPFAILLDPGDDAERGQLHDSHVQTVEADLSSLGTFDTEMLAAMPGCPADLQLQLRCPEGSKVGSFSTSVEGLTGPLKGELHRSETSPTGLVGVLDLPGDRIIGFKIEIDGVIISSDTLKMSIPSQLPLETTVVKIDAPILKLHDKPASCTNRETRMSIGGYSAGQRTWKPTFAGLPCPPAVSFVNPADEDADGDGFADDSLKPESFSVPYNVADGGNGINESSMTCALESTDPASAVRGKIKMVRDTGNGNVCEVTEAAGDVTVVFSVASLDGHVTVLKSSYNVDSEAPVVESAAPEVIESASTNVSLEFTFTDDRLAHPQSEYEVVCVATDAAEEISIKPIRLELKRTAGSGDGECMWDTKRSGRFMLEVVVRDSGGHVTVLKRTAVVDAQGPVITLTDWRDQDDDGDGLPTEAIRLSAFDIPFSVGGDDDIDPASVSCKLINPVAMDKDLRVADLDGDGLADVCNVTDAPGGPIVVEISAADYRGHVTVLKSAYTIDTDSPVFETTVPDKVVYDIASFDFEFEFTDDTAGHPQSKFKAGAELSTGHSSRAKVVTDRDTGRSKGFARFENVPDGDHVMTLTVEDGTGHVTVLKVAITVDAETPVIRLADTRDEDSDGDGLADDELRSGDFIVPFSVSDEPGVDNDDVQCSVAQVNPAFQQNNTAGSMPDGGQLFCPVTPPSTGPVLLTITATSAGGHVTVLKIGFTADTDAPVVTGLDRGVYTTPQVGDEFEVTDDTMTHPQSEYTAECRVTGDKLEGGKEGLARVIVDRDTGRSKGFCSIGDVPDGTYELALRVRDKVGHVTLIKRTIQVDTQGPVITLVEPEGTDSDGDGVFDETRYQRNFDRPFALSNYIDMKDQSLKCTVRGWDPTTKQRVAAADVDGDGLSDVCRFTDVEDGLHELEISAEDVHGHVTVLKLAITVDATPPAVTILSPTAGQSFTAGSIMPVRFIATGEGPVDFVCRIDSSVVSASCSSSSSFSLGGLSGGLHTFSVMATDSRGRSSTASVPFNVVTSPPPDYCIAIYPPPAGCPGGPGGPPVICLAVYPSTQPGCPGYVPPGGIIITYP